MKIRIDLNDEKYGFPFPIYLLLLGMLIIQVSKPYGVSSLISSATYLIVFSTALEVIYYAIRIKRKGAQIEDLLLIVLILICVISFYISFVRSYESFVCLISFLELPIFLVTIKTNRNLKIEKWIFGISILLSFYYFFLYFSPKAYIMVGDYGEYVSTDLTLGYSNPNETGIYLLVCFFTIAIFVNQLSSKLYRVLLSIDCIILVRLVFLTNSRSCELMCVLFCVVFFLPPKILIPKWINGLVLLIPCIYSVVTLVWFSKLSTITFLGDPFDTGRWSIYLRVLKEMTIVDSIFGDFTYHFTNLHNAYLSIYATIGIMGLVCIIVILYIVLKKMNSLAHETRGNKLAYISFLLIIIHSSAESALLTAGSTFAAITICFYLLSIRCAHTERISL